MAVLCFLRFYEINFAGIVNTSFFLTEIKFAMYYGLTDRRCAMKRHQERHEQRRMIQAERVRALLISCLFLFSSYLSW